MKKRLLSTLLVLCMVLVCMPGMALAGEPFTTLKDLDGTTHTLFSDISSWDGKGSESGPGWSWDGKNCVLTLSGYIGKSIRSDNMSKLILADGSVNKLEEVALFGDTDMNGVNLPVTIEGTGELIIYNTQVDRYGTKERIPAFQIGTGTPFSFGDKLGMTGGTNEGDSSSLTFMEHEGQYRTHKYASTSAGEKAYYVRIAPSGSVTEQNKPSENTTANNTPNNPTAPADGGRYSDVAKNAWYYDAVEYVSKPVYEGYDYGLMDGGVDGKFSPNANADRATIVTALCRRFNFDVEKNPSYEKIFSDVPEKLISVVYWAVTSNIVTGYGNGTFGPYDPVTREQFAVMLYRYIESKGEWRDKSPRADLSLYTDSNQISSWAKEAMSWANASGYITGKTSTTLDPKGNITRAEVATILLRLY